MTTLAEVRQKYPQYGDMSDGQLADALHSKFYSDIPRSEFNAKIGFDPLDEEAKANLTAMKGDLRPARPGDEISRDTVLPFRETMGPDGKPQREFAVPGLIMEPVRAAERLFTQGTAPGAVPMSQAPAAIAEQQIGDVMAAGSAAMPGAPPGVNFGFKFPQNEKPILGGKPRDELMAAAERQGIEVPMALASDSHLVRGTAGAIGSNPLGGSPIVSAVRKTLDAIESRRQEAIDNLGSSSVPGAGQTARDQIANWIRDTSQKEADGIYGVLGTFTDLSTPVPLNGLRRALSEIDERAAGMRQPPPAITKMFRDAAADEQGLTHAQIKDLRTEIGTMLESAPIGPQAGVDSAALKKLYAALSDDLEASVKESGRAVARENLKDPAVRQELRDLRGVSRITKSIEDSHAENMAAKADTYREAIDHQFRTEIAAKRESLSKIIGTAADAAPEAIVDRLVAYGSAKGGADIGRLQQAISVLDGEARNQLSAAAVSRIGVDKDGFSPAKFRTEMQKFSPLGKQLLFGPELSQVLDDIGIMSQRYEQLARLGNPSGTGRVVAFGGLGTAAGASVMAGTAAPILAAAAGIVGTYALARLLARPATARAVKSFVQEYGNAQVTRNEAQAQAAIAALREAGRGIPQQELGEDLRK